MKNSPLLILVGVTVISMILATVMLLNTPERFSPNNELIGEPLNSSLNSYEGSFEKIRIKDSENEVILAKKGSDWVVSNRQDYPVDNPNEIFQLLESLSAFKIGLEVPAEEEHFAQIGLLGPEDKEEAEAYQEERRQSGEASPGDPRGTHISVTGTGGAKLVDVILGEEFGEVASRAPRGFVVRTSVGNPGIWKALGTLQQRTGEAQSKSTDKRRGQISDPTAWLSYKFVEVEKIQSITLSAPNDKEFAGWSVTRPDEEGDFSTGDLRDDQEMDTGGTGSFGTLFSKLRFEDVLDPAEAEKKKDTAQARTAVIKTFDGFTYTFSFWPIKDSEETESKDEDAPPPPSSNYIGTVKVEAELPAERAKKEGETEEEAKNADQLFKASQENLKFKLEQEQAFGERTFEFASYTVDSVNKSRDEIVKKKEEPAEESANQKPGGGSVVSPPVALPSPGAAVTPPIPIPPRPAPAEEGGDE